MTMYFQTWGDVRPGDTVRHMSDNGSIVNPVPFGIKQTHNNIFEPMNVTIVFDSGAMTERLRDSGCLLICRSVN